MIKVGIFGEFQSGKSLLVNCILKRPISVVGNGTATTHTIINYVFSEEEYAEYYDERGCHNVSLEDVKPLQAKSNIQEINIYLNDNLLKDYCITDMPGVGNNQEDNNYVYTKIRHIDLALLVVNNVRAMGEGDSSISKDFLLLKRFHVPYYFILNCVHPDRWNPFDVNNVDMYQESTLTQLWYPRLLYPFTENDILTVNFMWYWISLGDEQDELIRQYFYDSYKLNNLSRDVFEIASNYKIIDKIFSMDNRIYLELRKEFHEELKKIKAELCPIGTIQAFAYASIPQGWLLCDGHKELISEHPELYDIIGLTYGGDGEKYFNVPDLRGRFIRGFDASGIIDKDRVFGSKQEDSFQSHTHQIDVSLIKISEGGKHFHPLWCDENDTVYDISGLASSDKAKRMCYPSNKGGNGKTDLGPYAGAHSHEIAIDGNPVSEPKNLENSIRIADETRPKNIAFQYCIKSI